MGSCLLLLSWELGELVQGILQVGWTFRQAE